MDRSTGGWDLAKAFVRMRPRLWDAFLFNDELDMLECRLVELENSAVYRHILVESALDFQGHTKPLYFTENRERFAPWKDRIVHVVAELPTACPDPWIREAAQRDAIARGVDGAEQDDWLILADVDEIPSAAAMQAAAARQVGILEMQGCVFYADLLLGACRTSALTSVAAALAAGMANARRAAWSAPLLCDGARGGHHLSWLGGDAAVERKLAAHCHTEVNDEVRDAVREGRHWREGVNPFLRYGTDRPRLHPVEVDSSWPRWIAERRCPLSWFRPR